MASITGPDEPLEPGFVFACDEDTVVITEDGYENLSAGLPRAVDDIETLMRERGLLQKVGR
jgi:Xaa-Pro aminopeptidase